MTVRIISTLATIVGLWLPNASFSKEPFYSAPPTPPAKSAPASAGNNQNQTLADTVARAIGRSGVALGAQIQVNTQQGVVELRGTVTSLKQADLLVQQAMLVSGVVRVDTSLKLLTSIETHGVMPAQALEPAAPITIPGQPAPMTGLANPLTLPPGTGVGMVPPMAMGPQEPIPLAGPQMPAYDMTGPKMPPNAWPTYAPYPNMSRVAYPQAYPYNAFPFIGPFYPFPKVPLGWRSVKLEWDDGHWYIGRLSTPHDYWKVKFW